MTEISNFKTRLDFLKDLESMKLSGDIWFDQLKQLILHEYKSYNRYIATRILYNNYPEKAIPFLQERLLEDMNYNIKIVNFLEHKRSNINDLMDTIILRKQNTRKMIKDITRNHLIKFVLNWREYLQAFHIFYDIYLKCFILIAKNSKMIAYLCNGREDPFNTSVISGVISVFKNKNSIYLKPLIKLLHKIFQSNKNDLRLGIINSKKDIEYPQFKLYSPYHEYFIYYTP